MSLTIRKIEKDDYDQVEVLTREAFWNIYRPGCSEHLVLHKLHENNRSIEDLELVVERDGKIVGHIAYSGGYIDGVDNETFITFGPISVDPKFQRSEIGSKLVRISMQKAARLGYSAVFITGDENYYKRFGFEPASKYGIHLEGIPLEEEAPFFMVKILKEDALKDVEGYFEFDECYHVNEDEIDEFDKKFEPKKKEKRDGQLGV
ncbi:GNAT family N-acetyltransferase [Intestinibacter bartlettii]|uniref:N-acetyltransferase n=1 Tax=Intestinibacter bartlettii TaxID=261299 RepID=A0ABS6E0E1_9FIRM|nr:N-acetyltransferase [Intestinibacter bartlettii]MBU5336962.1 N-acetyltransferase [Intestinibacter bartlettii]